MKNIIIFHSLSIIYCIILSTIKLKQNKHYIKVFIGTPPQKFNLLFDLGSSDFWIYDKESNESKFNNGFNKNNSISFQKIGYNKEINYLGGYASGLMCSDILKLGENTINNFTFLLINETNIENKMDGIVGCNKNLSFIDQLYNNKIISHKVFTQSFTTSDKGEISFGEIPKNIVNDYKNYGRCNALDKIKNGERYKNRKWECAITKALINDNDNISIEGENLVSFFSYRNRALVPSTFFNTLVQTYFKDLLNQKICETIKDRRYDVVSCKEIPSNSPTLTLVFGDWGMKLTKENLYIKNEQNNKYEFIFYHKQNFEHFTLGRPIVRFFHMVYDYQNQQIGFYSTTNVIRIAKSEPEPPKIFEFAEDKESKKDDKKDEEKKRKHITPEDIMNKNDKNPSNIHKDKNDKLSAAYIIQMLFMGFIFIIIAVFLIFGCYLYIRHKRKTSFYSSEFYMKQTDKFIGTRLGD